MIYFHFLHFSHIFMQFMSIKTKLFLTCLVELFDSETEFLNHKLCGNHNLLRMSNHLVMSWSDGCLPNACIRI